MKKRLSEKSAKAKRRLLIDSIGIFLIIISPFVFKLHQYLPGNPEATIEFLGLTFDRNGFADLSTYGWFLLSKIVPFYLLIMWFFTCKHWWYHIILIPISMYAFQLFEVIYSDDNIVDTDNLLWLLPVCMVVIPFVYLIRIRLYDRHVHGIDLEAMEAELEMLREKHKDNDSSPANKDIEEDPVDLTELSFSERIDYLLSTKKLESYFKQFQHYVQNHLHLKF
ncbi:hypothetical protein ACEZ3G_09755 [Maribacter algicola]|uniref:Uncharacterized protein n=1 Tax=Meishania litoralis TaxID=3434685 RepID=A0ACC7LKG1_9FLAO